MSDFPVSIFLNPMCGTSILVNRPIVTTPKGVALVRPPEKVLELLP